MTEFVFAWRIDLMAKQRKTESEKVATQLAKAMSLLSNLGETGRYEAFVIAKGLLEASGYTSLVPVAQAAANNLYRGGR